MSARVIALIVIGSVFLVICVIVFLYRDRYFAWITARQKQVFGERASSARRRFSSPGWVAIAALLGALTALYMISGGIVLAVQSTQ